MADEESPVSAEVLRSATDRLDDEEITLAENEEILHALSELTPVYENERAYFILGNYERERNRQLKLGGERLNLRQASNPFLVGCIGGRRRRNSSRRRANSR